MIEYEDALFSIRKKANKLGIQTVLAQDSLGSILARPVISAQHLPPFDNSAMDGFALAAQQKDVQVGAEFKVVGKRAADITNSAIDINKDECVQIMTG